MVVAADRRTRGREDKQYMRRLGERIAQAREALGLDQADVAAQLGVNVNTYGSWERAYRLIPLTDFVRLCRALHQRPAQLLGMDKPAEPHEEEERTLLDIYRSIRSGRLRRRVIDFALEFEQVDKLFASGSASEQPATSE
jgi:transcriptional regulator with XRE-family HTH domain